MIRSTFRCSIGVAYVSFFSIQHFSNVTQVMKVPAIKSVPPLGLHGSSTFTTDHSLYSSGRHSKSISIHGFPSSFAFAGLYPLFPTCINGHMFNMRTQSTCMILQCWAWLQSVICLTRLCQTQKLTRKLELHSCVNLGFNLNLNLSII